jgi:glycosyltransferase involved in cell wall biosynthesis
MNVASCLVANILVLIPSHNNASHVRRMLAQLRARGLHNLVVVDNGSSTAEMQDFLRSVATTAKVVRLTENRGPRDIFLSDATYRWLPDLFCVTDPDLEFNPNLPDDFLPELAELTERFMVGKAGFSLDIENRAEMRDEDFEIDGKSYKIWEWEEQFWQNRIGTTGSNDPVYRADIDTTFALYNKRYFDRENHLEAVRVAGNYTCRHLPWYRNHGLTDLEAATYRETQKFSYYMRAFG